MPYQIELPNDGCSQTSPCQVVTYFHFLGATPSDVTSDLQNYFGESFMAAHPHTIVVAPELLNSSATNNWGGVQPGVSSGMQQAVAIVQSVMSKYPTNSKDVIATGGSMGGYGTESALVNFGPNGLSGQHIFTGGVAYDGGDQIDSPEVLKKTLCGVPLSIQHGGADPTVPVQFDQRVVSALSGCANFSYTEIPGAGHGTWGDAYKNGTQISSVMGEVNGQKVPANTGSSNDTTKLMPAVTAARATCTANLPSVPGPANPALLPAGYLSTKGNQYVSSEGSQVRIASVGWNQGFDSPAASLLAIKSAGFNAVRVSWVNATMEDDLRRIDGIVGAAGLLGIKVILDNHTNEPGHGPQDNWGAQQKNGLWYDVGGASDGTDGGGNRGTVTSEKFTEDWVSFAKHYAGNPTVIGFDVRNEPLEYANASSWGDGNPDTDIRMMYERVGAAIQAVNPDVLIIVEGPQNYSTNAPWGDLTGVATAPVRLPIPNKLVYSVHDYPLEISGWSPDNGPQKVAMMNRDWGWIVKQNIAPVWVGEMGSSLANSDALAWAQTLTDYMNGKLGSQGGPTFTGDQQPISGDWWAWGNLPGQFPDGTLDDSGQLKQDQQLVWSQILFVPMNGQVRCEEAAGGLSNTDIGITISTGTDPSDVQDATASTDSQPTSTINAAASNRTSPLLAQTADRTNTAPSKAWASSEVTSTPWRSSLPGADTAQGSQGNSSGAGVFSAQW
jgi:aryl-phospho-beta-D-glucosidase BglC (GH1 family)/predicted esterase